MPKTLSNEDIAALVAKLEAFPYYVTFTLDDTTYDLGPLSGPPQLSPETETKDVTLYETGVAVHARYLSKNDFKVTVSTHAVTTGLSLIQLNKKGDNLLDTAKEGSLVLEPIIASGSDASPATITFDHASVDVDSTPEPAEGDEPNVVSVSFYCKADATTGKPFSYEADASET